MAAPPIVATQVYRALVYLYPPAFRRQFSSEMACDFGDATCEAWENEGWLAVLLLWIHICRDLVRTSAMQWLRNGPWIVLILSAMSAATCGFAIAQVVRQPFQPAALSPIDQDKVVLLFLATMVILLAVIVILFTVCFWLMVPKRRGRPRRV
jgi:cytochrome bd-type quinol oxidase subunit 1